MRFGVYLVRCGYIDTDTLLDAIQRHVEEQPPIGALAIESRVLSMRQVFEILAVQADDPRPFGAIAIERGLIDRQDLADLLLAQQERLTPLVDILIAMGALDRQTADTAHRQFHLEYCGIGGDKAVPCGQAARGNETAGCPAAESRSSDDQPGRPAAKRGRRRSRRAASNHKTAYRGK